MLSQPLRPWPNRRDARAVKACHPRCRRAGLLDPAVDAIVFPVRALGGGPEPGGVVSRAGLVLRRGDDLRRDHQQDALADWLLPLMAVALSQIGQLAQQRQRPLLANLALLLPAAQHRRVTRRDRQHLVRREREELRRLEDRKSTRLNSSHVKMSYDVFCLKKKRAGRSVFDVMAESAFQVIHQT